MTLPFFFQAMRRRIVLILIILVVVTGAGLALGAMWPKSYTSSAQILLGLKVSDEIDAQSGNLYLRERVATYAQTVKADEIIEPVAEAAGISPELLRRHVSVSIVPETVVLNISVSGTSAAQAVDLTNAVSARFQNQVSELNVETGGPKIVAAQFSSPQRATVPDQLHGALLVGTSMLVGLVLGVLVALTLAAAQALRESDRPLADRSARVQGSGAGDEADTGRRIDTDKTNRPASTNGDRPAPTTPTAAEAPGSQRERSSAAPA